MSLSLNTTAMRSDCQPKRVTFRTRIAHFLSVARQRRDLAALDAHLLDDIGVSRSQAADEATKSSWDVPNHWHH